MSEETTTKKTKATSAEEFTNQFFKSNKEHHLNFEEQAEDYCVSTGSIFLDKKMGGGFHAGVHRLTGATEGGKTSFALTVMKEMLTNVPNAKGIYIKAEGRLSKKMQARCGIDFTLKPDEWEDGQCLIFECNVYETVFDYLRGLLKNNTGKKRFYILIDSMDGLNPLGDIDKSTGEAHKVAGGAVMSSDFLGRVSSAMSKFGHMCIMISQVRAKPKINQYEKKDPNDKTSSSGGNAQNHYPDWMLEFLPPLKSDMILEKPDQPLNDSNILYGHLARVKICKSDNETTGFEVKYPIKRGRMGGNSVWTEKEVIEVLIAWGYIERAGSWFTVDKEVVDLTDMPEKVQGQKKLIDYLEENADSLAKAVAFVRKNCLE
jgi:RecA/RadA recombinase